MLGYHEIDTDLLYHERGKGGLAVRQEHGTLIKEASNQMLSENKLMNFGIDNIWELKKNYGKYDTSQRIAGNYAVSPKGMRNLMDMTSINSLGRVYSKKEFPKRYMGSFDNLGNKYISDFINKKSEA